MIVFDDHRSHTFLHYRKRRIHLKGTTLLGVDTNNVVAYFVRLFEAISEFPRVGDSPHSHRSLEGGEVLKLLTDI